MKRVRVVTLGAVLSLASPVLAWSATYHVAKGGTATSCAQAQTPTSAWPSIRQSLACLRPGDTLLIKGGTYIETLQQVWPGGTGEDARVTIKAAPGEKVTLRAESPTSGMYPGWAVVLGTPSEQYITFEGLTFDGAGQTQATVTVTGNPTGTPGVSAGAHHIRFRNCEFANASYGPSFSHTHHNEVLCGSIHDVGIGNTQNGLIGHGIYVASDATDNLVEGVEIARNGHYGIHNYAYAEAPADRNIYRNNYLHHNGTLSNAGCAILYTGGEGGLIANNRVENGPGGGICVGHAGFARNIRVEHNTVTGNRGGDGFAGIYITSGSGHIVRDNLAFNNAGGDFANPAGATAEHNLFGTAPEKTVFEYGATGTLTCGGPAPPQLLPPPRGLRVLSTREGATR
jgi:Right handed beta helix region